MENLINQAKELFASFETDAAKNLAGNKAAGARARKTSSELEKVLKAFRKASLGK